MIAQFPLAGHRGLNRLRAGARLREGHGCVIGAVYTDTFQIQVSAVEPPIAEAEIANAAAVARTSRRVIREPAIPSAATARARKNKGA